jgi:hypothetical protein
VVHRPWGAAALLSAVAALALAGAVISVVMLSGGLRHDGAGRVTSLAPQPGWKAAASFGPLTVERVERGAGGAHASAHEAEPGAVRSDVVRVEVRLGNRLDRPVVFSPGQFRLRVRGARGTISAVDPRRTPGSIGTGDTLAQPLAFMVPAPLTDLTLEFADLDTPRPVSIHLGSLAGPTS